MKKYLSFLIILAVILSLPLITVAQSQDQMGGMVGDYSIQGLGVAVGNVVWIIFTVIVVVCFVVAGITFLTAQGNPAKLTLARASFFWGIAGVVVGILAYSIESIIERML